MGGERGRMGEEVRGLRSTNRPWLVWLSGWIAGLQTPKGRQFNSQSGHMPGLRASTRVGGP